MTPIPLVPGPGAGVWTIETAHPGAQYLHGCVGLAGNSAESGINWRSALFAYTVDFRTTGAPPQISGPVAFIADTLHALAPIFTYGLMPAGAALGNASDGEWGESIFERRPYTGGSNNYGILYFSRVPAVGSYDVVYKRWALDAQHGWSEYPTDLRRTSPFSRSMCPSHTNHVTSEDIRPFIYFSDNVLMYGDPLFKPEDLRVEHRPGTNTAVIVNNSLFSWDVRLDAIALSDVAPPNLMVPCWQLSQGLQNYWNANAFYPSSSCFWPGPGGADNVVWDENELGSTPTGGQIFYPNYYSVLPGTWDLDGGSTADALYYSGGAAGAASDQWLAFRYVSTPPAIIAAEAAIGLVLTAGPLPVPGVYDLAQIDAAMGMGGVWVAAYGGSPFSYYQYFCFVESVPAGVPVRYRHGWFSQNYIHNAQVYGPSPTGGETCIPFIEHFIMPGDAIPGVPTTFNLSRFCRFAEVMVNGIEYWQGADWVYGITTNVIDYLNVPLPAGYPLLLGDRVTIKYIP